MVSTKRKRIGWVSRDGLTRLYLGDALQWLLRLLANSVHCVVTSPPYYRLRSYLPKDHPWKPLEIGREPTPEAYIENLVRVFALVYRVLHPSGLLFLNMGDKRDKDNQLLDIPWRVYEALAANGWRKVQTVIWHKPGPMPESMKGWRWERCRVKVASGNQEEQGKFTKKIDARTSKHSGNTWLDRAQYALCPGCPKCKPHNGWIFRKGRGRCTTGHEYLFILSKTADYFWDSAAFVEDSKYPLDNRKARADVQTHKQLSGQQGVSGVYPGNRLYPTRNPRTVWTISNEPTGIPHFAAFPTELARRCIQPGTSDGGCCPECLTPWAPIVETTQLKRKRPHDRTSYHAKPGGGNSCGNTVAGIDTRILEYRPVCNCGIPTSIPCTVLDPFAGIGRALQTAKWMGRRSIGIELNPDYVNLIPEVLERKPKWVRQSRRVKRRHRRIINAKKSA